jgi:hypothetical protein
VWRHSGDIRNGVSGSSISGYIGYSPIFLGPDPNTTGLPTTGISVLYFCIQDGDANNPVGTWKQVQLV